MLKQINSKTFTRAKKSDFIFYLIPKYTSIYLLNSNYTQIKSVENINIKIRNTHNNDSSLYKSKHFSKFIYKRFAASNVTMKQRIKDTNFFSDSDSKYIFQETKINKSLILFYSLLHFPFYLTSINLGFGLNFFDIDLLRTGIKTLPLFQAVITGINISSIINKLLLKIENYKNNQILESDVEEIKDEISFSEKMILISSVPVLLNFVISQIFVNFLKISHQVLIFSSVGFLTSNLLNLFVLFYFVYSGNYLESRKSSLFKINLIIASFSLVSFMLMIRFLNKKESEIRNPFLKISDENRIENLKTINEYVKEDTKMLELEISELMEEITPEKMELMERIFKDEE